ncbi:MAG: hypothetical protein IK015_10065 [Treponema sp.]|nr:hypothetical protein [Treponema sp.]
MSLMQALTDIFDLLFRSNAPEVQKKIKLRKIESELRVHPSGLYKNELVQPNFAEALRVLYENIQPIANILDNTIASPDIRRNHRFEEELIVTGYTDEDKRILDSLSYEELKKQAMQTGGNGQRSTFDEQKKSLEKIVTDLNGPQFSKMDEVITSLHQLADLCHFNFVSPLQLFDDEFATRHGEPDYVPDYQPIPPATLESTFLDLYYLTADYSITMAVGNATLALNELINGVPNDTRTKKELLQNLRRIQAIIKHTLNAATLKALICIAKGDPAFAPQKASYKENVRKNFAEQLQKQFTADEQRILNEMKDNYVKQEIDVVFPDSKIETLVGYNSDTMDIIGKNAATNFMWVMPLRLLKTFLKRYYSEPIRSVVNDIVVEGLFTNPAAKSSFSQTVFAVNDSLNLITQFEDAFGNNQKYSLSSINNLIADSHKNAEFSKKLTNLVDNINNEAKDLIQKISSMLLLLHENLGDCITDTKRSKSELVSNLKGIMFSSRNRESTSLLELQYPLWKNFFDIIRNYVIIKKAKDI